MRDLSKITASHLAKTGFVYIRQSTIGQVTNNRESLGRQYELRDELTAMGFKDIVVIDEDLGKTGSGKVYREGFEKLMTAVTLDKVGIVMGLEASRLARNNAEMAKLVELCRIFDTLIGDHAGIYNPRLPNDRMVLGFKGTLSELELDILRERMLEGANHKARRGELWTNVSVGYLKEGRDRIIKDPDQRVQDTISKVFSKFFELGSARQVYLWFMEEEIPFPKKERSSGCEIIEWGEATHSGLRGILHNPLFAGAYCRGRRKIRKEFIDGVWHSRVESITKSGDWDVFILDNHEHYITWLEHLAIQRTMMDNCKKHNGARGAVQKGTALLQGLVRCKRCGKRMGGRYHGNGGDIVSYYCQGYRDGSCSMIIAGKRVEKAVVDEVLNVVQPFALRASREALATFNEEHEERVQFLDLEISQADYQVTRARRRYEQVDSENRLVAANLEKSWNQALEQTRELEQRREALQESRWEPCEADKRRLLKLARDLPRLWQAKTTTASMKKQIIRSVVEEIWADQSDVSTQVDVHWKGGQISSLQVERRRNLPLGVNEEKQFALIKQMANQMPDDQVVFWLNRLNIKTGKGNIWTAGRLRSYRSQHKLAVFRPDQQELTTMRGAALELDLTVDQVKGMVKRGILVATQVMPKAPWAIKLPDLRSENVQKAVKAIKNDVPETLTAPWKGSQRNPFEEYQRL